MDASLALEAQLHAEIDQLRAQFPRTQELYREVCVLLFFRHGIAPTANRLYQLVKKGSMSAPAEALTRFWATLREKSRVRIEHPDLPTELQSATGELAAALWTRAVDMAQDQLAAAQLEAQRSVADAHSQQTRAEAERDLLRQELTGSAAALDGAQTRVKELDQALAISVAAASALRDHLGLAQQDEQQLQRALETARHDFASELDKLRADSKGAQERLKAAETRALLEIDRERQAAARLQKDLDTVTRKAEQGSTRQRDEVQKLQGQLGDLRQQVGVLEGNLDALRTANSRYIDEAAQAREQRDQLALSLTHAASKQKPPAAKPTAGLRKSIGPVRKSQRTRQS
ncbi:DNA-binding protein [Caballeronia sordidicola]|uniref:DNA-binding protein n=1 Tax=Caballeronia sordidicola TaxID=196367 RepID=UPI00068B8515|nr:DNA-binding protein [Caballeronia sordidicola]